MLKIILKGKENDSYVKIENNKNVKIIWESFIDYEAKFIDYINIVLKIAKEKNKICNNIEYFKKETGFNDNDYYPGFVDQQFKEVTDIINKIAYYIINNNYDFLITNENEMGMH